MTQKADLSDKSIRQARTVESVILIQVTCIAQNGIQTSFLLSISQRRPIADTLQKKNSIISETPTIVTIAKISPLSSQNYFLASAPFIPPVQSIGSLSLEPP
jgi:hypothetical protein